MRPFDYDYDDLDELEFEQVSEKRRRHHAKQHHKSASHKRHTPIYDFQWDGDDWDNADSFDDYSVFEVDDYSGNSTRF